MKKLTSNSIPWLIEQFRPFLIPAISIILIGFVISVCSVGFAVVTKILIDSLTEKSDIRIFYYALLFIALVLLQVILGAINHVITTRTQSKLENRIQERVFDKLSRSQWRSFTQYHSGDLMTRLTSDVKIVSDSLVNLVTGVVDSFFHFLIAFITLCFFDPILAVIAFLMSPLLLVFSRIFGKKLKQTHLNIQEAEGHSREMQTEMIQNMLVIKAFQQEQLIGHKIADLLAKRLHWRIVRSVFSSVGNAILSLGYWISYLLAFGWGASRIYHGTGTYGTLTAFLQLIGQVQGPFMQLAYSYPGMISLLASAGRVEDLEKLTQELYKADMVYETQLDIILDHIHFSYRDTEPILANQSLRIKAGSLVGITGSSGEGKTTFIQLLLALLYPSEGHIYFERPNGSRIEASPETRSYISYVPQGNSLFSGSVADNLRVANPHVTDEEMIQVLHDVGAWDFVSSLPDSILTRVGEKGFGLSEGQIQRLAIARALLKKTPILIFDEATSALDAEHEKTIFTTIMNLPYHPTCLIVTHRPSALTICDQILNIRHPEFTLVFKEKI